MSKDSKSIDFDKLSDEELASLRNEANPSLKAKIQHEIARREAVHRLFAGKPINIK